MPDIYLGPSGSETKLPAVNWIPDSEPDLPIGYKKTIDKVRALDGSYRVNIRRYHLQDFRLEWAMLSATDALILQGLAALNQVLHYQNNWLDASWRWIVIEDLQLIPIQSTFAGAVAYYRASMTFFEVTG